MAKRKKNQRRLDRGGPTTPATTLKSLMSAFNTKRTRTGNANKSYNDALTDAVEFRHLNKAAFAIAMKFMALDAIKARRIYDDFETYIDVLGFHKRKASDLFRDHAPKADKSDPVKRRPGLTGDDLKNIGDVAKGVVDNVVKLKAAE